MSSFFLVSISILFIATFGLSCPADSSDKKKVILDTDIGVDVDDTLALLLLLSHYKDIEIIAIHTHGVQSVLGTRMIKKYSTLMGHGYIPVYHGTNNTFTENTDFVPFDHIGDGVIYPQEYEYWDKYIIYDDEPSIDLYNSADYVIAIGALTNIANLFELNDKYHIKNLILMGGSLVNDIYDSYKLDAVTFQKDYNFRVDPDAVIKTLSFVSNIDNIAMITGNITLQCWLTYHDLLQLKHLSKYQLPFLNHIINQIEIWSKVQKDIFIDPVSDDNICFLHDPLALSYVFEENVWSEFMSLKNMEIGFVITENGVLYTVNMDHLSKDWNNEKENMISFKRNIMVSTSVNCENFRKFFLDSVSKYQYPQL